MTFDIFQGVSISKILPCSATYDKYSTTNFKDPLTVVNQKKTRAKNFFFIEISKKYFSTLKNKSL